MTLSGAGLPLTDGFAEILTRISDHGPQQETALADAVRARLFLKEKRILSLYGTWGSFTAELLAALAQRKLVQYGKSGWGLGAEFALGKRLPVTSRVSVTIMTPTERHHAERLAQARLSLASAASNLRATGVSPERIGEVMLALLDGRDVPELDAPGSPLAIQVLPGVRYTPFLTHAEEAIITDIVAAGGGPRQIRARFGFDGREMEHQALYAYQRALGRLEERLHNEHAVQ